MPEQLPLFDQVVLPAPPVLDLLPRPTLLCASCGFHWDWLDHNGKCAACSMDDVKC
ncbi:hypothetical protein [Spongiibacter sp.]|uniref:hypothetical protein n=1 Tax=Spongiibacter sp. TaxID=2024860 RepID=UPI00257A2B6D|nr:hypothetical protein [Spongiibacter sp.]